MADVAEQAPAAQEAAQEVAPAVEPEILIAQDTPITGTQTPEEDDNSKKVTLADLSAKGTALYAKKQYEDAAECFAKAAELQAEVNGEMNPTNSDILFLYGRSLFKVGQSKSDVLGGQAGGEKKPVEKKQPKAATKAAAPPAATESAADRITEEGVAIVAGETSDSKKEELSEEKKPLFQFTGDENFDDSDDEEDGEAEGEEAEEEEDDLAVAFEVLDLARVLFLKQLEALDQDQAPNAKGKDVAEEELPSVKHIKERLADTHDLLAEISLENERYPNAIVDTRESLKYKKELYPEESEVIAEAHFKLSLALEFASVTTTQEDGAEKANQKPFDEGLREEAAKELEAAIASTKLKLQNKEVELATMNSPEDNEITRAQIAEVKEIIADMEGRLVDLRKPPIDVNAALMDAGGKAMGGILGAALGETPAETEARIEEAKKSANDLSGLVRKKNKEEPKVEAKEEAKPAESDPPHANGNESNGTNGTKRKAEEPAEAEEESKKARVEDAQEA